MIVSDLGTSFRTAFIMMVERYGASSRTAPIESPWQIGMVERHGGVIGEVNAMIVHSFGIRVRCEEQAPRPPRPLPKISRLRNG